MSVGLSSLGLPLMFLSCNPAWWRKEKRKGVRDRTSAINPSGIAFWRTWPSVSDLDVWDNSIEKPGLQTETLPNKEILRKPTQTLNKKPTYGSTPGERSFKHASRNEVYVERPALICPGCGPARFASLSVIGADQPSCADISAALDGSGIHNTQFWGAWTCHLENGSICSMQPPDGGSAIDSVGHPIKGKNTQESLLHSLSVFLKRDQFGTLRPQLPHLGGFLKPGFPNKDSGSPGF
ncbi:hypothetical protein DFH08DRAFT_812734 [Mycena albidolilacea]|uniref:Uncharacterized protein n=1 Tax=Mycena albidolilacea TaxID=1033008 RepID=A0AAD6ZTK6_9AGAR|nr:hypothetical protein DFH08DRAFT_812734 [Mycena albidolilacea]